MEVLKQLEKDYLQAFKAKNELAVLVLRQLKTAITNAEIVKKREKLTAEEITKLLRSEVKKRREAIELYQQGGRPELADKEKREIEIVSQYLPPELGEDEIKRKIAEVIKQLGVSGPPATGKVMSAVMKELAGQADCSLVSQLVKAALEE